MQGVNRYNSPATNCPCVDGYIEMGVIQSYCCPQTCQTCNLTQCLSCPIFTYRVLTNGSCACMNNLVEIGEITCGCPLRMYVFNSTCVLCPFNCYTCSYNPINDTVYCVSCQPNMSRDMDPTTGCSCLDWFK